MELIVVTVLGLTLAIATFQRPEVGLMSLVIGLPLQNILLARLLTLGYAQFVDVARFWKEALLVALLVHWIAQRRSTPSTLSRLVIVFLGVVLLYMILPVGPDRYVKLLGARQDAAYLVVFLIAMQCRFSARLPAQLESTVLVVGTVVAGLGLWNLLSPIGFSAWLASTGINEYQLYILHVTPVPLITRGTFGGIEDTVRASSIFLSPVVLAYYLAIPVGIVVARLTSTRLKRWQVFAGAICATGLIATLTRSALLAMPLMILLALFAARHPSRLRMGLAIGLVALWPLGSYLNLDDQVRSSFDPRDVSAQVHASQLSTSRQRILSTPLGSGLGTSSYIGRRFDVPGNITNESWYFQIGTELGILPMILYVWIVLAALRLLWRRARANDATALAAFCGLIVIALGGIVLHTLESFQVAWTIWAMTGLALRDQPSKDSPVSEHSDPLGDEMPVAHRRSDWSSRSRVVDDDSWRPVGVRHRARMPPSK